MTPKAAWCLFLEVCTVVIAEVQGLDNDAETSDTTGLKKMKISNPTTFPCLFHLFENLSEIDKEEGKLLEGVLSSYNLL